MDHHASRYASHRPKFDDLRPKTCYYDNFAFVAITTERNSLSRSSALHTLAYQCLTCGPRIESSDRDTAEIEGPILDGVRKVMPHPNIPWCGDTKL